MYAPIDYDRSLYIFCCNKRVCSLKSDGWTVIRNQQENKVTINNESISDSTTITTSPFLSTESRKGVSSKPFSTAAVTPAPASIWGSLSIGEDDGEIDMLAMLEARDAALTLKKAQPILATQTSSKSAVVKPMIAESLDVELAFRPLLPQALRCWKVEAVSDPCPYSTEMLINTAMGSGDDDDEDDPFHMAESESAIQHIQQMLAGYVAESELEGEGDDQGGDRDNPVLLELLKNEMTAHKNKQKQKVDHSKQKATTVNKGKCLSSINSPTTKAESTSDNRTEKDDDSMLNKSDIRSRVERAFYATISHAPSQVMP
jgi:hypothetical protein